MYTEDQRREHISGLQQDLRVILAAIGEPLPKISGTYDAATEQAVRIFQKFSGLPVTGYVDLTTWDRIVHEANLVRSRTALPLAVRIFPSALHVVTPGDQGRFVYILQGILNGLTEQFPSILPLSYTGVYDQETQKAIAELQRSAGLRVTGHIDADTWNALAHMHSHIGIRADSFVE